MGASLVAPLMIVAGLRRERVGLRLPVTEPGKALAVSSRACSATT